MKERLIRTAQLIIPFLLYFISYYMLEQVNKVGSNLEILESKQARRRKEVFKLNKNLIGNILPKEVVEQMTNRASGSGMGEIASQYDNCTIMFANMKVRINLFAPFKLPIRAF